MISDSTKLKPDSNLANELAEYANSPDRYLLWLGEEAATDAGKDEATLKRQLLRLMTLETSAIPSPIGKKKHSVYNPAQRSPTQPHAAAADVTTDPTTTQRQPATISHEQQQM